MKRGIAAMLAALCLVCVAGVALADNTGGWYFKTVQVPFRFYQAALDHGGVTDSLTRAGGGVSLFGSTQPTDTTEWVNINDMVWALPGTTAPTTAFGILRLTGSGSNNLTDTLFVFGDWTYDGTNTYAGGTANNMLTSGATTYDNLLTLAFQTDMDAAVSATQVPYGAKSVRFRIRADGNTGALISGFRLFLTYPAWR